MEPLQVMLFGGFQLRCGKGSVPPMPSRAARSLFAYLVVQQGTVHPRDRIAAEFWADLPAARARRRLSHTLWQVQDALGELVGDVPYVQVTSDSIGFDHDLPITVDVKEFEHGLDRTRAARADGAFRPRDLADLEATVELYRGEFLAGHYDAWIAPEQERLHQRYLEALSWLVASAKQQGAYDDALVYARRVTNEDPLREDAHREVMRLSVLLGRTSDAIRQFERCSEVLSAELDAEPSTATVQLYERIIRRGRSEQPATVPDPTPFPDRIPLVGRAEERDVAVNVLERALAGRGGAVLVEGEPGLGKSRLLAEVVDDAHWRSFVTLHASCHGPEAMAPYTVVQDLLEGVLTPLRVEQLRPRVDEIWLAEAAKLVPVLARALPGDAAPAAALRNIEGAQRMRDALAHVLIALSGIDPIVMVVDDLQWADVESMEVLEAVSGELQSRPAVLLIGYRGNEARARPEVWAAIRGIDRRVQPERLLLAPLDGERTGELARALGRGYTVNQATADQLQRETGGNPLFLMETLRTLTEQDMLSLLETEDVSELPLPRSIHALVVGRLESLSREVREVLDLAAIAGDGVDLDLLTEATELPREVVVDAADTLVRNGLLSQTTDALELRHHQVRRATLEELSPGRSRALHYRVGQALERLRPSAVERVAHHLVEADRPREAVPHLVQAATSAIEVHAYTTADTYLRTALEQQSRGPVSLSARFELLAEHESVLDVLGDREAQGKVVAEMALLAETDPRRSADVARRRSSLLAHRGDLEEAIAVGRDAVAAAEEIAEVELLGPALVTLGTALLFAGRNLESVEILRRATRATSDDADAAEVRTALANVLFRLQRYEESETELERALRAAVAGGSLREEARALGTMGAVKTETGDWPSAAELFERAIERCRSTGFRHGEAVNLVNLANVRFNSRELPAAQAAYSEAEGLFRQLCDDRGEAMVRMNRGFVRFDVLGDDLGADADLRAALDYFVEVNDPAMIAQCCDGLAGLAARSGDLVHAKDLVRRGLLQAEEAADAWAITELRCRQAHVLMADGAVEAAYDAVTAAVLSATEHGSGSQLAALRGLEGEILLELGRGVDALEATAAAVSLVRTAGEREYIVRYQHHLALEENGHAEAAADELATAVAELEAMLSELDPVARSVAQEVPEHARIMSRAVSVGGQRLTMRVAVATAPVGRPLRPAEVVTVVVDLDPSQDQPDDPVERRRWLLQDLVDQIHAQGGAPTVGDLAGVLEVSQATIRRDLAALRGRGEAVATRGHRAG